MQTIAPLVIDNTPTLDDLRRAAAKFATPEVDEEYHYASLEKRALAAIIERAFSDEPARGLTYPEEIEHLTDWLTSLAVKHVDTGIDRDMRLLAMTASYMNIHCEEGSHRGEAAIELVRAVATYFLRVASETVADVMLDGERGPQQWQP